MQRVAVDLHRAMAAHPQVELSSLVLETSWKWTGLRTGPFLLSLLARLPRFARDRRVDVVLFSSMVTASIVPLMVDRLKRMGVMTAAIPVGRDLTLPSRLYQRLVPRVLADLDLVFPISRATAAAALERGAALERVRVIPCGVDFSRVEFGEIAGGGRQALLIALAGQGIRPDPDAKLLLSVGRHQERKGFHWFVEHVVSRLPENFVYLLAGSGPMTQVIRERVAALGLVDRVHLLGQVSEELLRTLYAGADLFVMPNVPVAGDMEGFGVVMLEAGAAGLPVVAADLEGIRDVITPGENGWLVPSGDAAAFAERIEAFGRDGDIEAVRERTVRHTRERFGWGEIVDRYLAELRTPSAPITSAELSAAGEGAGEIARATS